MSNNSVFELLTFSPEVINAVLDGDTQIFMKNIPHSTTPREAVTVHDMEIYHYVMEVKDHE